MPSAAAQKLLRSLGVLPAPDTPDLPSTTRSRLDQAGGHDRCQRQDGGGGVAAGVRHLTGAGDGVAVQLGQAVLPLPAQVGGEIDDRDARTGQLPTDLARDAMGQRQQDEIALGRCARVGRAGNRPHPGMRRQQPHQLTTGKAGGAEDGGGGDGGWCQHGHVHEYTQTW